MAGTVPARSARPYDREVGEWHIRPARPEDADAAAAALTEAGVAAWGGFLGADRIRQATTGARHPVDLVAEDAVGVFAFVAWDAATGEILRLYTHPRAGGRGAGRALLDAALDALRAAGRTQAWLNTEERNADARRFYERLGWREEGEVRERTWHGARLREPRYVKDL
jgi:ribosomal protein S18 acetylase RimI-like enzyme